MVSQTFVGALKAGAKIGKYEIQAQVATGGMAIIYKALDPSLARLVAVKQIAPHLAADPRFVERFRGEAQTLARLSSSQANIVSVYELVEQDGQMYMVMEFVEGTTLRTLMDRGPVPLQTGLGILLSTALGLRAMHVQNIIHRDLSPANIMVAQDGGLKITDFGLIGHSGGKTSLPMGTTKYMAPEMFTGTPVDPRADLYSLGFIAYEMFAGPQKFAETFKDVLRDEKAQQVRWMHWHSNPVMKAPPLKDIQPGVPPLISKIIERMMEKDPAKRFASADQIIRWFRRIFVMHVQGKSVSMSESENLEKEMEADTGSGAAGGAAATALMAGTGVPAIRGARPGAAPLAAAGTAGVPALSTAEKTAPLPTPKWTWQKAAFWAALIGGPIIMAGIGLLSWKQHQLDTGNRIVQSRLKEANKLFEAGEYKEAVTAYDSIIQDYQDDPTERARVMKAVQYKWFAKAQDAFRVDELDQATSHITMAEKNGLDLKQVAEFRKKLDARVDIKRQTAEIDALVKEDQFDEAMARLQALAQAYALDCTLRIEEIKQLKIEKIWTAAVKKGDEAMAAGSIAEAKRAYLEAQHVKETQKVADIIAGITKTQNFAAHFTKAQTLFAQGKYDEAIAEARLTIAIKPSPEMTELIRKATVAKLMKEAVALKADGLKDKAIEKCKEILAIDPTNPYAQREWQMYEGITKRTDFIRAGDTAMAQKKYADAIEPYRQALNLTDSTDVALRAKLNANILECKYQVEMVAGSGAEGALEWENAKQHYLAAQGIKDTPQVKDALANLEINHDYTQKFQVAKELFDQKQYVQAEKQAEEALKVKDTPEARDLIRECEYRRNRDKAQELGKNGQITEALGVLRIAEGKATEKEKFEVQAIRQQLQQQLPPGSEGK